MFHPLRTDDGPGLGNEALQIAGVLQRAPLVRAAEIEHQPEIGQTESTNMIYVWVAKIGRPI